MATVSAVLLAPIVAALGLRENVRKQRSFQGILLYVNPGLKPWLVNQGIPLPQKNTYAYIYIYIYIHMHIIF